MLDWKALEDRELLIQRLHDCRQFDGRQLINDTHAAYEAWKAAVTQVNDLRTRKNALTGDFVQAKQDGDLELANSFLEESKRVGAELSDIEDRLVAMKEKAETLWARVPNIPDYSVPDGGEDNNIVCDPDDFPGVVVPPAPSFDFPVKDHVDLGTAMKLMDFEQTAKISGTRFVTLIGALAKLERVLANWMIEQAVTAGCMEVSPPTLVKPEAMFGTGQLPKFEDDLFKTAGDDPRYLIPTAEVSLTNHVRDSVTVIEPHVPWVGGSPWSRILVALTPCYRAEAGAAGRDSRGMMRMHEFKKVELVGLCADTFDIDVATSLHKKMLYLSQQMLVSLGLHFRTLLLSGGDMGFSAKKTYDLEVWLPSEGRYREIASISNCGDFQARRMNARYKFSDAKGTHFLTTLNGSALAVGRTLLAVMENYQNEQGGVVIPQVLREAMGGTFITPMGEIL